MSQAGPSASMLGLEVGGQGPGRQLAYKGA